MFSGEEFENMEKIKKNDTMKKIDKIYDFTSRKTVRHAG